MNKAIFLDRDGTINVDTGYTHKIKDLEFEQKAIQGLQILQNLGYKLIIITGQSGIGRNYYSEQDYHKFMNELYRRLKKEGIKIEKDYFCPHAPEDNCNCRKPKTKMLEQAITDFNINISKSWVIGDKTDDIEMGRRANCRTILVKTSKAGEDGHFNIKPDFIAKNLAESADYILSQEDL